MSAYPAKLFASLVMLSMGLPAQNTVAETSRIAPRATPTQAEQDKILGAMRDYAEGYISRLPNFLCVQTTQQFEAGRKGAHWRQGDTLTSKLIFDHGGEERTLQLVNNKPAKAGQAWRAQLRTEGEFGLLIANVLGEASAATFSWQGWETIRGRRVAVFRYSIDRQHSTLRLTLSDLARSVVAYGGSVYGDAESGGIWRITNSAFDIPREVQTKSISTTVEYDQVAINGTDYLLPAEATVTVDTGAKNIRNEMRFGEYRKFETSSTITYRPPDSQ